jgi:hypothetical protein
LELSIPLVWGRHRLNLSCNRSQEVEGRSRCRFIIKPMQFVKVVAARLTAPRFLVFFG